VSHTHYPVYSRVHLLSVLLLAVLTLLSPAVGDEGKVYEEYYMRIAVIPNGTCHETIDVHIRNTGQEPIRNAFFTVVRDVQDIAVRGVGEDVSWTVAENQWIKLVNITFTYPVLPGKDRHYSISFTTDQFVRKEGEDLEFRTTYNPSTPISDFSLTVQLPPGYILPVGGMAAQTHSVLFPPAELKTDGQHLLLVWARTNVTADDSISVFARFTRPKEEVKEVYQSITPQGIVVGLLIGLALFSFGRWATQKRPSVLSVFTEDEQAVVESLIHAGGRLKQRDLLVKLDISKSKLSRLVMDLESRSVLRKERMGNTNRLVLRDDLKRARIDKKEPESADIGS